MKKIITIVLFSALGGALTLGAYKLLLEKPQVVVERVVESKPVELQTNYGSELTSSIENTDFTVAAEKTLNAVVHVKNTSYKTVRDPLSEFFYGRGSGTQRRSQVGTGSGVIISEDGYIITNNHVIDKATDIEVTLNDRKNYTAELVGTDASNDIALLKIDSENLPYITFGDSDYIKVGEWVLAVGNPYNLTSTVTAGIVSAKGRDLEGNSGVESFIQTDAAVNPGNSGGALVNTKGELIGINTAITSRTGSFIGYSFAVPSNIAKKVIEDLIEFGNVQNALLGIVPDLSYGDEGVKIGLISEGSGAEKAGLKADDIIISINNIKTAKFSDLKGHMNSKRPGDNVEVIYLRDGVEGKVNVTLTKNEISRIEALGIEIKNMSPKELKEKDITYGVKMSRIWNKELLANDIEAGYIITKINNTKIRSVDDANNALSNLSSRESIRIEMRNLKGEIERIYFR